MKVKIEPRSRWKGARKFSGRSMRLLKCAALALASVGLDGLLVVRLAEHPLAILAGRSATGDRWLILAPYFERLLDEIIDVCERPGLSIEERQRLIDSAVEQTPSAARSGPTGRHARSAHCWFTEAAGQRFRRGEGISTQ